MDPEVIANQQYLQNYIAGNLIFIRKYYFML